MVASQLSESKCYHDCQRLRRYMNMLELLVGIRPYRVVYPPEATVPTLKLCKFGFAISLAHIAIFCGCVGLVLWVAPPSQSIISDSAVAALQNALLANMQMTTAFITFSLIFLQRKGVLKQVPLERRIKAQMRNIPGYNLARFYRNSARVYRMAMFTIVFAVVELYACDTWFWWYQATPDQKYMFPFFSLATVMPFMYAEMVIVQFGALVIINKLRMDELNDVLQRMAEEMQERGEMYAEYYVGKR